MSGSTASTVGTDNSTHKWAALDKQHERLVDATHPLLAELRRDHPDIDRSLRAWLASPPS
jgi:hypothetical protein